MSKNNNIFLLSGNIDNILKDNLSSITFSAICSDTRQIKGKNVLFFVFPSKKIDVFSLLKSIEKQVNGFVVDIKDKDKIYHLTKPVFLVKNINKVFRYAVKEYYKNALAVKLIGITGTNGKTTTAHFIYHCLTEENISAGLLGTMGYNLAGEVFPADYTTPPLQRLYELLDYAWEKGVEWVTMEVSSHSISQQRIWGLTFNYKIFTNLTRDHLDYHRSFKNYAKAKKSFFLPPAKDKAIINLDDVWGKKIIKEYKGEVVSYGFSKQADFQVVDYQLSCQGIKFILEEKSSKQKMLFNSPLLGKHNIYNLTAGIVLLRAMGNNYFSIKKMVKTFQGVGGRLMRIAKENIFVDYAHTPDGLKNVLKALKQAGYKRIIVVFGCGGDRDKGKRKIMGQIACKLADYSFITSDNPRGEPAEKICKQIAQGFTKKNYTIIIDRYQAIKSAINLYKKEKKTALLVAGKGEEQYQIINGQKIPFNDRLAIMDMLK